MGVGVSVTVYVIAGVPVTVGVEVSVMVGDGVMVGVGVWVPVIVIGRVSGLVGVVIVNVLMSSRVEVGVGEMISVAEMGRSIDGRSSGVSPIGLGVLGATGKRSALAVEKDTRLVIISAATMLNNVCFTMGKMLPYMVDYCSGINLVTTWDRSRS